MNVSIQLCHVVRFAFRRQNTICLHTFVHTNFDYNNGLVGFFTVMMDIRVLRRLKTTVRTTTTRMKKTADAHEIAAMNAVESLGLL